MFKKKEIEQFISHDTFAPFSYNPNERAASLIGNLTGFLLKDVESIKHKVVIESDNKTIEIIVSVETHKTAEDG